MSHRFLMSALRGLLALLLATTAAAALAQSEQQKLVNAADATFQKFMRDPDMTWLAQNIGRAKGVLIEPALSSAARAAAPFWSRATPSLANGSARRFTPWPRRALAFRQASRFQKC
jgi:hypothetical protein